MTDLMELASRVEAGEGRPEPKVLIFADDAEKTPRLYACATCGTVHSPAIYLAREEEKHAAAYKAAKDCYSCKTHSICKYCGALCNKHTLVCHACIDQRAFDAATEVADDGGPYCVFNEDTYFTEMEQAQDAGIEWVSPCSVSYPHIDADSVLENLLDDMHEDASIDDMKGVEAFYAAVKAFNDAQTQQSWFGDSTRKIRVPKRQDAEATHVEQ